jgi:hypothetical protein
MLLQEPVVLELVPGHAQFVALANLFKTDAKK